MSNKIYKTLRQYARFTETPYKRIKHSWDRATEQERQVVLPSIKRIIEEAKKHNAELDTKEKEKQMKLSQHPRTQRK